MYSCVLHPSDGDGLRVTELHPDDSLVAVVGDVERVVDLDHVNEVLKGYIRSLLVGIAVLAEAE
jgi:hypothetical protein